MGPIVRRAVANWADLCPGWSRRQLGRRSPWRATRRPRTAMAPCSRRR